MSAAVTREPGETQRDGLHVPPLRRTLAALLLPLSMVPVLLLAPSLLRAPELLVRRAAHALAPAHHAARRHAPPDGPRYYLVGPARFEIEAMEGSAGAMTPKVGVSPLDEPELAAREAAQGEQPSILLARGRELTTASGEPLKIPAGHAAPIAVAEHAARADDGQPPSAAAPKARVRWKPVRQSAARRSPARALRGARR